MISVGVTGTICSGKTTISRMLGEMGARVIEADRLAHQLMSPFSPIWWAVSEYFGPGIIDMFTSEIDRTKLGAIVFGDPFLLQKLNSIVHPGIIKEIECQLHQLSQEGVSLVVIDAPLLIEVGLHCVVDVVVVIVVRRDVQMARLHKRYQQLTDSQIIRRINSQLSQEIKQEHADFLVDNNGDLDMTGKQVRSIFHDLMIKKSKPENEGCHRNS